MTSPHGKGVQEQAHLSVRPYFSPSVMLLASLVMRVGICDGTQSTSFLYEQPLW